MQRTTTFLRGLFLPMIVLFVAQVCSVDFLGDRTEEKEYIWQATAHAKIASPQPTLAAPAAPAPQILPEITTLPANSPQIELKFTAENSMDLPSFRANLSTPISINHKGASPWPAAMQAEREDDYQKLGGLQPGTVRQTTSFEGAYDLATGKLTGTLTHQYFVGAQGTAEYLAFTTDYRLTCNLEAQRVGSSAAIEGLCTGQSTQETIVSGEKDYNRSENKSVNFTVTGSLPEELQK